MDVKNFLAKILKGNLGENIPQAVKDAFNKQFDNPLNPEWVKTMEYYEAVFYKNELEHLARFNSKGNLENLKVNMPLDKIPENITNTARKHGELMNAIAIHRRTAVNYELIVRDKNLIRYFLLLDLSGEVIEKEKL